MEIKVANNQEDFFGLVHLRKDVFVHEQSVDIDLEMDDEDYSALHFVAIIDNQVIGTCRLVIKDKQAKLGRMAIAKPYRFQHIGSRLLLFCEEKARSLGISTIVIAAQIQALDFYLSHNYQIVSELFYEANIAHKMLEKKLL